MRPLLRREGQNLSLLFSVCGYNTFKSMPFNFSCIKEITETIVHSLLDTSYESVGERTVIFYIYCGSDFHVMLEKRSVVSYSSYVCIKNKDTWHLILNSNHYLPILFLCCPPFAF